MGNEDDGAVATMLSPSGGGAAATMIATPTDQGVQGHEAGAGKGNGREGGDGHPPSAPTEMEVDDEAGAGGDAAASDSPPAGEQEKSVEFEPPQASVQKLIKRAIGESVQVGKEAKATFTRAAGIFILYLTACANDFCRDGKRTTITVNDVYQALRELDFEDFMEPLRLFMQQHTNSKKAGAKPKKASPKPKVDAEAVSEAGEEEPTRGPEEGEEEEEEEEEEEAGEMMVGQEEATPAMVAGEGDGDDYDDEEEGDEYEDDAAMKDEDEEDARPASEEDDEEA